MTLSTFLFPHEARTSTSRQFVFPHELAVGTSVAFVAGDREALAGVSHTAYAIAILTEADRDGIFKWDAADLSDEVTADPLQGLYIPPTGEDGSDGAWVRQHNRAGLSVAWFGALADGVTDDQPAIQAALDFAAFALGGRVVLRQGVHQILAPIVISSIRGVSLVGHGSHDTHGGSILRANHVEGPVLRIKGRHVILRDFVIYSDTARRTGGMITKDNFTVDRDEQNYGIWQEADDVVPNDTTGAGYCDDLYAENVWVHNQPNSGWVIIGGMYGSVYMKCGVQSSLGHGIVFDSGVYTGRTNVLAVGVCTVEMFQSYKNSGHALAVTHPDNTAAPWAVRIIVRNLDAYTNGTTPGILWDAGYDVWFFADSSRIEDSAVSANTGQGAIIGGGRQLVFENNRLLTVGTDTSAMKLTDLNGRETSGVRVELPLVTVTSGAIDYLVDTSGITTGRVSISDAAVDGVYLNVGGPEAAMVHKGAERIERDNVSFESEFRLAEAPTTLTIAGGIVTATSSYHRIDTEAAAASDELNTINGGTAGQLLVLQSAANGHTVILKHGISNLFNAGAVDMHLNSTKDKVMYIKFENHWDMLGWGNNGPELAAEE